ncbi:AAA family ATPase [Anaerococcus rubeinfantis]|uniref:AAA family ATPase n=1 Tax=Anaerococcus rubeinfantis TaxID=1720199 RepID=UPI00073E539F|nr:AAA family ATPase [Anaerococcus rubeinfantis]
MKLYMENIGKLANTEIDIDGITVIAGKNGTGKSTIGKALYSVFSSFYAYKDNINQLRNYLLLKELRKQLSLYFFRSINEEKLDSFLMDLYKNRYIYKDDKDKLKIDILNFMNQMNLELEKHGFADSSVDNYDINIDIIDNIMDTLFIDDETMLNYIVSQTFNNEFNNQVKNLSNLDNIGRVNLRIKDKNLNITFAKNGKLKIKNPILISKKVVYIDDPYIIDKIDNYRFHDISPIEFLDHRDDLFDLIKEEKSPESILIDESLSKISKHISKASNIDVYNNHGRYYYISSNKEEKIDIKNASTGLKTFIIIKMLLENGSLQKNGTIVLDEPETHLHPDWQIIFAELIVLLNKYLGMHILINSHSPYFVRAIEVYSSKHEVADKCKYYLAYDNEKSGLAEVKDVSDSVNEIYSTLSSAFDILEQESLL